ncbi:hypothetical protein E8E68_11270 [Pseudomonas sp. BN607]|nr:hypothetical protein [Pseudomonas sp. BN607]
MFFPRDGFAVEWIACRQARPFRGHARSHRYSTGLKSCDVPVGAGVPAKGPGLAKKSDGLYGRRKP